MTLTKKLAELGNNSQEVAESLFKEGIKGKLRSKKDCPILNYLHRDMKFKGLTSPCHGYITWNDEQTMDPCCSEAVTKFMEDFDSGKYPELVG